MDWLDPADLDRFRSLIAARLGLHFDNGRNDLLADVLHRRLEASGHVGAERYLGALSSGAAREEFRTLASLLTVTETYFFRAPEHFRALVEVAAPARLHALHSTRPLRILSAGCASGDEAYSIAITLCERLPDAAGAEILGVDINPVMLARAREARYGSWSLRETPPELRDRYFARDGAHYLLAPRIRRMLAFEEHNLGVDCGASWNPPLFDVVFCRNTMMYMVPEAARCAVACLTRLLVPAGFLFLSHAETLRGLSQDFHLCHTHDTFYYQKRGAGEDAPAPAPVELAYPMAAADQSWVDAIRLASENIDSLSRASGPRYAPSTAQTSGAKPSVSHRLAAAVDLLRQERFRDALEAVRGLPPECAADRDALLLRAVLLTNCGEVAAAQEVCRQLLSSDDLNASAQYLTALCCEHAGDDPGAIEHNRAAVYLDPGFAMPHLHLGLLAKRRGDWAAARRELERAALLLEREDASRILLLGGGFSRQALLEFSRAECQACGGYR